MLFHTRDKIESTNFDLFDRLQHLVNELLKRELPNHDCRHHLLFTANTKLVELEDAISFHYKQIDVNNAIGQFHKEAYERALTQYSHLNYLTRGFLHLNDETERKTINHHFKFDTELIKRCYEQLQLRPYHLKDSEMEKTFWKALKQDLMPVISKFE